MGFVYRVTSESLCMCFVWNHQYFEKFAPFFLGGGGGGARSFEKFTLGLNL